MGDIPAQMDNTDRLAMATVKRLLRKMAHTNAMQTSVPSTD